MLGNANLNILRTNCPFTRASFSWASLLSPRKSLILLDLLSAAPPATSDTAQSVNLSVVSSGTVVAAETLVSSGTVVAADALLSSESVVRGQIAYTRSTIPNIPARCSIIRTRAFYPPILSYELGTSLSLHVSLPK